MVRGKVCNVRRETPEESRQAWEALLARKESGGQILSDSSDDESDSSSEESDHESVEEG